LKLHHDILQKKYVNGLNAAEIALEDARRAGNNDDIKCLLNDLAYNGSGDILHTLYFNSLAPRGYGGVPENMLMSEIINAFGNFDDFKEQFSAAAAKTEGSEWALLCWQPDFSHLVILQAKNHQNGTVFGTVPILALDVWEHAYYLDYKTDRNSYIKNFWNYVNWKSAEERLADALSNNIMI
jgi:Fe-Mn family superoxide dismutase